MRKTFVPRYDFAVQHDTGLAQGYNIALEAATKPSMPSLLIYFLKPPHHPM